MKIKTMLRSAVATVAFVVSVAAAGAQGVPVIDGTNLAKNIEQLQAALRDFEQQVAQIEELKKQVQTLTNLEALTKEILGSITGPFQEIASLYNTAEDIRSRAAKISDLSGFQNALAIGDFDGLLNSLLDGNVTMGQKRAQEAVRETLAGAGFTSENLSALSTENGGKDAGIAKTAAANATAIAAAQFAYDEAAESLGRIDGLVEAIGRSETLKESIDLNTRMVAETNYMLGSMWRLNAAQGLASGQTGVNWAAEQAKERAFFTFGGGN